MEIDNGFFCFTAVNHPQTRSVFPQLPSLARHRGCNDFLKCSTQWLWYNNTSLPWFEKDCGCSLRREAWQKGGGTICRIWDPQKMETGRVGQMGVEPTQWEICPGNKHNRVPGLMRVSWLSPVGGHSPLSMDNVGDVGDVRK